MRTFVPTCNTEPLGQPVVLPPHSIHPLYSIKIFCGTLLLNPPVPCPRLPLPYQFPASNKQFVVHSARDQFRGTKQRSTAKVYKQFDMTRVTVLFADDIIIPASLK